MLAASVVGYFSLLAPPLTPRLAHVSTSRRTLAPLMAGPRRELELIDSDGDAVSFCVDDGDLKMFVNGKCMCESVQSLAYGADGTVSQDDGEGMFTLREEDRQAASEALCILAEEADVTWVAEQRGTKTNAVVETALPPEIEALLTSSELKASRPGVCILWSRLLDVYPTEKAALAAAKRNSALVLPYLNRPANIDGSWEVLKGMMSEEEALDVITKNPGVLACNPVGLKGSNAGDVQRAALLVDVVESLPMAARWAIPGALSIGVVGIVAAGAGVFG
jgi:hypothetical protein